MIDQYVSQLDSPDAERRKKAVIALGKSGDRDALPHLSRVYKTDPNPEIRELALKAGRYLKRETEEQEAPSSLMMPEAPTSLYDEKAESAPATWLPKDNEIVTDKDIARAKELIEQVLDWHVRGKDEKAKEYLKKALQTNPKLRRDAYTVSLAATVTGLDGDEAIASLMRDAPRKEKPRGGSDDYGRKSKDSDDGVKEVGWGDAMIDLMLYALVWAGGLTAMVLLGSEALRFLGNTLLLSGGTTTSTAELQEVINMLPQLRVQLIIFAIVVGLLRAVGVLIQAFVVHFSAVSILGGDGNVTTLIHGIVPTYIVADIVFLVLSVGYLVYAGTTLATASAAQARSMTELWGNINNIYQFALLLWVGFLIGKVYRYGMFKGCLAEFISYILFVVLGIGMVCCFISLGSSLLGSTAR